MKALLFALALGAGHAFAVEPPNLFGIQLGAPMTSIPACKSTADPVLCLSSDDKPMPRGERVRNRLTIPTSMPPYVSGMGVESYQGRVISVSVVTWGRRVAPAVLAELTRKFGQPSLHGFMEPGDEKLGKTSTTWQFDGYLVQYRSKVFDQNGGMFILSPAVDPVPTAPAVPSPARPAPTRLTKPVISDTLVLSASRLWPTG